MAYFAGEGGTGGADFLSSAGFGAGETIFFKKFPNSGFAATGAIGAAGGCGEAGLTETDIAGADVKADGTGLADRSGFAAAEVAGFTIKEGRTGFDAGAGVIVAVCIGADDFADGGVRGAFINGEILDGNGLGDGLAGGIVFEAACIGEATAEEMAPIETGAPGRPACSPIGVYRLL